MILFSPIISTGFFSDAQGQLTPSPWSDLAEFQTHVNSYVTVIITCKYDKSFL